MPSHSAYAGSGAALWPKHEVCGTVYAALLFHSFSLSAPGSINRVTVYRQLPSCGNMYLMKTQE